MRLLRRTWAVDRLRHVLRGDQVPLLLPGPVVRLPQQIGDSPDVGRQLLRIPRQARAVFDDARHGAALEMAQPVPFDDAAHQGGIRLVGGGAALRTVVEIGRDLEQLRKLRIMRMKQIVEQRLTQQHHLDVQRDGFGFQRHGVDQAEGLPQALNAQLRRLSALASTPPRRSLAAAAGARQSADSRRWPDAAPPA